MKNQIRPKKMTVTAGKTTIDSPVPPWVLERMEREYQKWGINRAQIMETLLDLLDLYIHYRPSTAISTVPLDAFLQVRIPLNEEMDRRKLPRYTEYVDVHPPVSVDQGRYDGTSALNGSTQQRNGINSGRSSKNTSPKDGWGKDLTSPSTNSSGAPGSGSTGATSAGVAGAEGGEPAGDQARGSGSRGRDGTVRFMLNPDREREERGVVGEYGREDTGG